MKCSADSAVQTVQCRVQCSAVSPALRSLALPGPSQPYAVWHAQPYAVWHSLPDYKVWGASPVSYSTRKNHTGWVF